MAIHSLLTRLGQAEVPPRLDRRYAAPNDEGSTPKISGSGEKINERFPKGVSKEKRAQNPGSPNEGSGATH
jgi:hypothetical protein